MAMDRQDTTMEALFAEARATTPKPHKALTDSVLALAREEHARRHVNVNTDEKAEALRPARKARRGMGFAFPQFFPSPVSGGWQLAGGFCAATLLGLWLGFNGVVAGTAVERITIAMLPTNSGASTPTDTMLLDIETGLIPALTGFDEAPLNNGG